MFDRKRRIAEELLKIAEDLIDSEGEGEKVEVERLERWAEYDRKGNFKGYYIIDVELDDWAAMQCTGGLDIYDYVKEMGFEDVEEAYIALAKECVYINENGEHTEEARKKFEEEYRCRLVFEEQSNTIFPAYTIIPEEWE
jgi:hypothetical protein